MSRVILIKNSVVGILQYIFTAILTLISVPIFINKLGMELYGVFAILSVVGNLNLITNFGLKGALLVYIAKQGKTRESDLDIIVTQIILLLIVTITVAIIYLSRNFIVINIFSIPEIYQSDSNKLLMYLVAANVVLLIGQPFTAVLDALEKIHLTNMSQFMYSLFYWGGLILMVSLNAGLIIIGKTVLVAALLWLLITYCFYRKYWGDVTCIGLLPNFKRIALKQIKYGSKIYFSGLVGFLFEPFSKILISHFIGLNAVALFEIGTKIRIQISGLFNKSLYPLFPFIAKFNNDNLIGKRLFDISKKIHLLIIPLSIILMFTLPYLLGIWLGNEFNKEVSIFTTVLTLSLLLFSPPIIPVYHYLASKNKAEKNIWIQLSSVIVNVLVFFMLFKISPLYSILFANFFALFASYLIGNYYQFNHFRISFKNEIHYFIKLFVFGILTTLVCLAIFLYKKVDIWDLVVYPITVGTMFVIFVRQMKILSTEDINFYFFSVPPLKRVLNFVFVLS